MKRRELLKYLTSSLLFSLIPQSLLADNLQAVSSKAIIKPNKLQQGQTIGLIAPGSFITEEELNKAITNIESLGFKIKLSKNILQKYGYLAGTDEQRLEDIHQMFADDSVEGIICVRGGYGCSRLLPNLNYELIKSNPKPLIGYSDVTALLIAVFELTGLITFHGPVGISDFNEFTIDNFKNVLMSNSSNTLLFNPVQNDSNEIDKAITIRAGKSTGRLIGGNLSIVVSLIGTKYNFDSNNKIIFLEDIGEEPYRIDRMLTQMLEAGKFENASAVIFGACTKCASDSEKSGIANSFNITEVIYERLYHLNIPIVFGMSFGHISNKFTLPVGINSELNTTSQTITLLESAVI